jgi:hypothetical protein
MRFFSWELSSFSEYQSRLGGVHRGGQDCELVLGNNLWTTHKGIKPS